MNLHQVRLNVYENNARTIRACGKWGFHEEGRLREATYCRGRYHDMLLIGILSREFRSEREAQRK
jgi:RimJ/RimL family protein N-acetyltransferase